MTRTAIALDRLVVLVVGLALSAIGVGALLWPTGLVPDAPELITAPALVNAINTPWWRWAVAGAGLVCVVVALRWIVAHLPALGTSPIRLHEAADLGTVSIDPRALAEAAADALERHPAVRTAKGKVVTDRGTRTIELAVTSAHPDELPTVVNAVDNTCADIARATGQMPLSVRTTLHIKGGRELTRARVR